MHNSYYPAVVSPDISGDLITAIVKNAINTVANELTSDRHNRYDTPKSLESKRKKICMSCSCQKDRVDMNKLIDRVIAQDRAIIVFWKDGTKTSVKCSDQEKFDYEKGLAMAILKYVFGNKYYTNMMSLIEKYPHAKSTPKKSKKKTSTTKTVTTKSNTAKKVTSKK